MTMSNAVLPLSFQDGLKAAFPVIVAYVPIGFSFGITATSSGIGSTETILMSLIIYSGAAQFLAVALVVSGAPLALSILTLVAMNLRHLLYGPSLLKAAQGETNRDVATHYAWLWGFGLTDEVFGAALARLLGSVRSFSEAFISGLGAASYGAWVGGTVLGAFAGGGALDDFPILHAALIFMYPAMFLSFLLSILSRRHFGSVVAAGVVTIIGMTFISVATGILGGMITGAAFNVALAAKTRREGAA